MHDLSGACLSLLFLGVGWGLWRLGVRVRLRPLNWRHPDRRRAGPRT